jgi:TatD DNase family protein
MIDTHAHIYDESFKEDLESVLSQARSVGVQEIWMPNCNAETISLMFNIEKINPAIYRPMMGLHPCYVAENYKEELKIVQEQIQSRKFIMIGEIGLDYYWDISFMKEQKIALENQIKWSFENDLPICIHSRNSKDGSLSAIKDCIKIIKNTKEKKVRGIFHCFSGNLEEALEICEMGFLLGIGGVISFKNGGLDQFINQVPLSSLVLETDAPYLAPVPHRGKRNQPEYLSLVAQKLADVYGISLEHLILQTSQNAKKLLRENY